MKTSEKDCLVSQLYIETDGDLKETAQKTVRHETAGKWDRPGSPTALFEKSLGYLLDYDELCHGNGYISFAYPLHNLDMENSAFSHIWTSMITGMSAMPNLTKYRVVDFTLPYQYYACFPGPQFGIEGTRKIMEIDDNTAVIGSIVKPTCGLTAD